MLEKLVSSGTLFAEHLDRFGRVGKGVGGQGQGYSLVSIAELISGKIGHIYPRSCFSSHSRGLSGK